MIHRKLKKRQCNIEHCTNVAKPYFTTNFSMPKTNLSGFCMLSTERRSSILSSFDRIIKSDFFCFNFSQSFLGDALWCLLPLRSSECAASTSHFFSLGHHTSMISLSQLISASLMMLSSSSHMSGFLLAPTYVLLPFHLIVLSVFFQNLHIELS